MEEFCMLVNKHKNPKIDKFAFVILATFFVLAGVVVLTFKTVFSSIIVSYEITDSDFNSELRINYPEMEEAYKFVFEKEKKHLTIQE